MQPLTNHSPTAAPDRAASKYCIWDHPEWSCHSVGCHGTALEPTAHWLQVYTNSLDEFKRVAQSRSILEHTTLTGRSIKSYSDGDNRDAVLEVTRKQSLSSQY